MNKILENLLSLQMVRESGGNPHAISPMGAKGLTQFVDKTFNEYKKVKGDDNLTPYNPNTAVDAQRWYMNKLDNSKDLSSKFGESEMGKAAAVLASYNMGPTGFLRSIAKLGNNLDINNPKSWFKVLPTETSNYISSILYGTDKKLNTQHENFMTNSPLARLYQPYVNSFTTETNTIPKTNAYVAPGKEVTDYKPTIIQQSKEENKSLDTKNLNPINYNNTQSFTQSLLDNIQNDIVYPREQYIDTTFKSTIDN